MSGMKPIGRFEHWGLRLVFGGPISLWVRLARMVGVAVDPDAAVDDTLLSHAEDQARIATGRFAAGLAATTVCLILMVLWYPTQSALLGPVLDTEFDAVLHASKAAGLTFWPSVMLASLSLPLAGVGVGLLNASVFGGIPMLLLRRSTIAAAPAVSVALAQSAGSVAEGSMTGYPRVAYAVERILGPSRG